MNSAAVGRVVVVLGVLGVLAACGGPTEELVQGLEQNEALEVMVLLDDKGLEAKKESVEAEEGITYTVKVTKEELADARKLLVAYGIPRHTDPGYAEATASTGMIPSAGDEMMKSLNAKQGELNNALMAIDGVLGARTLINIPEIESLSDGPPPPPTASVVLRLRRVVLPKGEGFRDPEIDAEKVKRIVANAVQGLDAQAVEVMMVPVETSLPDPTAVKSTKSAGGGAGGSKEGLFKILAFGALLLAVVLAILLMLAGKQKKDLRRRVIGLQRQMSEGGGEKVPARA